MKMQPATPRRASPRCDVPTRADRAQRSNCPSGGGWGWALGVLRLCARGSLGRQTSSALRAPGKPGGLSCVAAAQRPRRFAPRCAWEAAVSTCSGHSGGRRLEADVAAGSASLTAAPAARSVGSAAVSLCAALSSGVRPPRRPSRRAGGRGIDSQATGSRAARRRPRGRRRSRQTRPALSEAELGAAGQHRLSGWCSCDPIRL